AAVGTAQRPRIVEPEHGVEDVEAEADAVAEQRLAHQERVLARPALPREADVVVVGGAAGLAGEVERAAGAVIPGEATIEERDGIDGRERTEESDLERGDDRNAHLGVEERGTGTDELVADGTARERRLAVHVPRLDAFGAAGAERVVVVAADVVRPAPEQAEAPGLVAEPREADHARGEHDL